MITAGTTGSSGGDGSITSFGIFLFRTLGINIWAAFGD